MSLFELRHRLFRFATRPLPRLQAEDPERLRSARRAYRTGMLIICSLTVWLLAWLAYHWLWRPDWIRMLPELLAELLLLVETAGAFTLAFVWAGLDMRYWRQMEEHSPLPPPAAVLSRLYELSPKEFESYVAGLYRQKGYDVTIRGGTGDHGVDLELVSRHTGRRAVVQCKRYQNTVGAEVVRELYGTLLHERVSHAFLVTTAEISDAARTWARGKPITLIDGATLVAIDAVLRRRARQQDNA